MALWLKILNTQPNGIPTASFSTNKNIHRIYKKPRV